METYLFKFSACLAIFWLVYILFLERQTMHRFKRFYLLVAVAAALIIPALTITHYVPVNTDFEFSPVFIPMESSLAKIPQVQAPFMDLETVLWIIYGLGVLLFSLRFTVNLFKMYQRISDNETITKSSFIYVLLEECRIPHSFFKYLFFDKSKYETNLIPNEVKLHEETHAKQLHSLDIIVIELLQIVFWFHPLIYILKHHIKLNHEFLADQAVLEEGIDTKAYQKLLLQFSSPDSYRDKEYQLSSAINYSSIKKRFTVMKTQTSKTRIWLSSLLLLPIIAILFYSFAEKEYVEKVTLPPSHSINDHYARSIDLKVLNDNSYLVDGIKATKRTFVDVFNQLHQDITPEVRNNIMNIHVSSSNKISNKETWFIYNALQDYGFYRIVTPKQDINRAKGNTPFAIKSSNSSQQNPPTANEVAAYNTWAKKTHGESTKLTENATWFPPIDEQKFIKFKEIYNRMSQPQKNQAVEFPFPGLEAKTNEQQGATKEQITEYNKLAKHCNSQLESDEFPIIKVKDVKRIEYLYGIMSEDQKKNAESYPDFSKVPPPFLPHPEEQERPTVIEISKYDVWAKKMNVAIKKAEATGSKRSYPIIKKKDYDKYYKIYRTAMSEAQRKNAEPFPNIPPPPPPKPKVIEDHEVPAPPPPPIPENTSPEERKRMKKVIQDYKKKHPKSVTRTTQSGEIIEIVEIPMDQEGKTKIAGKEYFYKIKDGLTTYYDRHGNKVDINRMPPPPPPTKAPQYNNGKKKTLNEIIKETPKGVESGYEVLENGESHYYTVYKDQKTYYNKDGFITDEKGNVLPPPPPAPPSPESTLDFDIRMAKANAKFFYKLKPISSDKAIDILKKKPNTHINAQKTDTKEPLVYMSNKPILIGVKEKSKN
jgi:beta-lactamase regulating signal transducer with metallopeptidase domain